MNGTKLSIPHKLHALRQKRLAAGWGLLLLWAYIFWCEGVLRANTGKAFWTNGLLLTGLFSVPAALLTCGLCRLFSQKVNRILHRVLLVGLMVFYVSQLIYYYKFHCFYNAYSMGNGGQVLEFWQIVLKAIYVKFVPLMLLILPCIALLAFDCVFEKEPAARWHHRLPLLVLAVVSHFAVVAMLPFFGEESSVSAYQVYHNTNDLQQASYRLGLLPAFRLDLDRNIFGFEGGVLEEPEEPPELSTLEEMTTETTEEVIPTTEPRPVRPTYNQLKIDFDALLEGEENETVRSLHEYFSAQMPTEMNEKSGLFAGCNLIEITAEGFSYLAIDPELTPTLYKLQHEGFYFTNFYTPYWGVSTSDGEYVTLTGTIPKSGTWSFSDSADNAMPLTMAQQLKHRGYSAYAYHDHSYTYYHRNLSHPNLGYVFRAVGNGLEITDQWPESDVEMIQASVQDYVNQEPFHAYYMTVSGHLEYDFKSNAMAAKHREAVEDLPYSEPVKAYLACQIELDRALELLLQELEAAGVLENTVIVLSADHYPYGLTEAQQSELAGHELDSRFELYRNACIIYKAGMEPEVIDRPCSSLDILPTLSNLFGLRFDSRLYMGQDVFSEADPLIIFSDRSWLTTYGSFYSVDETVTSFMETELPAEIVQYYNQVVADKFLVSQWVLEEDYWRILFGDNLPPAEE